MKLYAKKLTVLTFLAGALGGAVSALSKDWIFSHVTSLVARLGLLSAPPICGFALVYLLNLAAICLSCPPELQERVTERWTRLLPATMSPELLCKATDCVDRAAAVLLWMKVSVWRLGEARKDPGGFSPSFERAKLIKRNEELSEEVATLKKRQVLPLVGRMASVWTGRGDIDWYSDAPAYLEDPIYGQIALDPRLRRVFYHPLFQRLNYIRQLSFAYLVFPSASHSRLSHILGVMRNAEVALRRIFDKGWIYTSEGRRRLNISNKERETLLIKVQLCALLHDIGHGPFGHALDKLIPYLDATSSSEVPDKVYSVKYARELLGDEVSKACEAAGFEMEEVLKILDKESRTDITGFDGLILDLIDSPLDVDRMDYLVRDAHMTGLGMGYSNVQALIEHMCPFQSADGYVSLTYEEAALPHLEHFVYTRDIMYINCYEHPRKVCAERILARLTQHLLNSGLRKNDLMLLSDAQLLDISNLLTEEGTPERYFLRSLQENFTFEVCREYRLAVYDTSTNKTTFNEKLRDDVRGWRDRRMGSKQQLKSVFITTPTDWEEQICGIAGLDKSDYWKVLVTVPAFDAKQEQESQIRLLIKDGAGFTTQDLYDASTVMRAEATNLRPMREVIRVMVLDDLSPSMLERLGEAADSIFMKS